MKNSFLTLMLLVLPAVGFSQFTDFDIFGTQTSPYSGSDLFVTLDTLQEAKTLEDINGWYRPSWVATYNSVGLSLNCQGEITKAVGANDTLTQEQINILKMADFGCSIEVVVDYIPQNNLKHNPPRQMHFTLTPVPIFEASYPGGFQQLRAYLKKSTVDKISDETFEKIRAATVRFNIDEKGQVSDPHILQTSEDAKIDQLMLDAICNMPAWNPAENSQGTKVSQEFAFSMGTMLRFGCYKY